MKAYDESITTMKESVYARMKMTQSTNVNVSKLTDTQVGLCVYICRRADTRDRVRGCMHVCARGGGAPPHTIRDTTAHVPTSAPTKFSDSLPSSLSSDCNLSVSGTPRQ